MIIDFCGDVSFAYDRSDELNFERMAKSFNEFVGESNYRIANLESPIISQDTKPIIKEAAGVNHKMSETISRFLSEADIDAYSLANNHMGDYGVQGICMTIDELEKISRKYVGASKIRENVYNPLRITSEGISISIISVCEHEFGTVDDREIGVAGYNPELIKEVIFEEKRNNDWVVVIFHGGTEFYPFPTPKQKSRYHNIVDWGVDVVVSMHSHCPVGYEHYRDSDIFYGLGNLFFPHINKPAFRGWYYGYIVRFSLEKDSKSFGTIPYYFDTEEKRLIRLKDEIFDKYYCSLSEPIQNDSKLQLLYDEWTRYVGDGFEYVLKEGILHCAKDIFATARVKNLFSCESHNELLSNYYRLRYNDGNIKNNEEKLEYILSLANCQLLDDSRSKIRIILWGVSDKAKRYIDWIEREYGNKEIVAIVDTDCKKQGRLFNGCRIFSIKSLRDIIAGKKIILCTKESHWQSIRNTLYSYGVREENIYDFYFERKEVNVFGAGKFGKALILLVNRENGTVLECLDNSSEKIGESVIENVKCAPFLSGDREIPLIFGLYDNVRAAEMGKQCMCNGFESSMRIYEKELIEEMQLLHSRQFLEVFYFINKGEEIDFCNPKGFNQKMQYLKIYGYEPRYSMFADKYRVKQYISKEFGEQYVIPTYGIWNQFADVPMESLPNEFVLKCTHDSGSVKIVDKNKSNIDELEKYFNEKVKRDYYQLGRETCYRDIPHKIMAEVLLQDEEGNIPMDYKFFCFAGNVFFIQVDIDRFGEHRRNIYSVEWDRIDLEIQYKGADFEIKKPKKLGEMLKLAKEISKGIPFVRVDLYEVRNRVFFGEMTFYHGNGIEEFRPAYWDQKLGELIPINN